MRSRPPAVAPLLPRQRNLLLGTLLLLAGAAWVLLIWQASGMSSGMGLTMGMGAPLFLTIWVVMMVAMMFPASAPMIVMFARIQAGKQRQGRLFVPTWVFVAGYLLIWTLFGGAAFGLALGAQRLGEQFVWVTDHAARLGGILLILAGVYQISPLKQVCLAKCQTPLAYVLGSWRDGRLGALRMGIEHGLFCLGCCWLLFLILFPLGVMNIAVMVLLTALIFAEKTLPSGHRAAHLAAFALVAYGVTVVLLPAALPAAL